MEAIGENMDSDFWAQEMIISLAEWAYLTNSNEKSSSDAQVSGKHKLCMLLNQSF